MLKGLAFWSLNFLICKMFRKNSPPQELLEGQNEKGHKGQNAGSDKMLSDSI